MTRLRVSALLVCVANACGGIAVIDDAVEEAPSEDPTLGLPCGGPEGTACGPNTYCDRPEGMSCTGQGVCRARPLSCPAEAPEACACDGLIYPNACIAQASGVEAGTDDWCLMQASARAHIGEDRLTFMFQDSARDVCVRLVATHGVAPAYALTMSTPWQPVSVAAFNTTDSCLKVNVIPPAPELIATAATGSALLEPYETHGLTKQFCRLQVALEVDVPEAQWLTMPFTTSSPDTPVEGACP